MQAKVPQPSESVWGVLELLVGKRLSFSTLLEAVLMGPRREEERRFRGVGWTCNGEWGFALGVPRAFRNRVNLLWLRGGKLAERLSLDLEAVLMGSRKGFPGVLDLWVLWGVLRGMHCLFQHNFGP